MTIKYGDIDVMSEIIELNFQLRRTQKILEIALNKMPIVGRGVLDSAELTMAEEDALAFVQKKFPNMGIKKK